MTDTALSRTDLITGIEASALVLAQKLGLGDQSRGSDDWPIDQGDTVLQMAFEGEPGSSLVLAVNDDVADRLLSNPSLVNSTFAEATQAINDALGTTLVAGTVERGEATRPSFIAEILDNAQLTAVAGLTLPAHEVDQNASAEPPPASFEPEQLEHSSRRPNALAGSSLSVLHDVELVVTAELGRTIMAVRDVLGLAPGMVVEIDRAAGAPIDLLVNGRRIAAGEVVVIDEEYGIRITEIAPPSEHSR